MTKELPPDEIDEDQLSRDLSRESAEAASATDDVPGEFGEASDTGEPPKQPRRKPGRPPGLPKTGGRVKGSPKSYTAPEIRNELLERSNFIGGIADMAFGRKMYCSGATGKPEWRYPQMKERLDALKYIGDKILPTLAAQELSGPSGKDLIPAAQLDSLETARAVFGLMREAKLKNGEPVSFPVFDAKLQFHEPRPVTAPAPVELEREYQVGETEVFDNGAYIQLVEIAGSNARKWDIRDELNAPYGYSSDRQAAVTRARAIKRSGSGEQG